MVGGDVQSCRALAHTTAGFRSVTGKGFVGWRAYVCGRVNTGLREIAIR